MNTRTPHSEKISYKNVVARNNSSLLSTYYPYLDGASRRYPGALTMKFSEILTFSIFFKIPHKSLRFSETFT